jgi:UDP-glucose 4-epimerase
VRDYIHVVDLGTAHLAALEALELGRTVGAVNLGTGHGYSVGQVVAAAARVLGRPVPHTIGKRRPGDPAELVADPARAGTLLGWRPLRSELTMILDDAARSRLG